VTVLFLSFYKLFLCMCVSLFYLACLYSCLAFFLVIFVKTAKLWVGHRVGHGLAQVLYTPVYFLTSVATVSLIAQS